MPSTTIKGAYTQHAGNHVDALVCEVHGGAAFGSFHIARGVRANEMGYVGNMHTNFIRPVIAPSKTVHCIRPSRHLPPLETIFLVGQWGDVVGRHLNSVGF